MPFQDTERGASVRDRPAGLRLPRPHHLGGPHLGLDRSGRHLLLHADRGDSRFHLRVQGGWLDSTLSRFTDIMFAIPLILADRLTQCPGEQGFWTVSTVLIVFGWPTDAAAHAIVGAFGAELDYIDAARALGASDWRIITRHVLPNGITPVIVYATITGVIISAEASLSFLNVGLQLPAISWGLMISVAQNRILAFPHLLFFPGIFLSLTVSPSS